MGILQLKKHVLYPGVILGFTLVLFEFFALFFGLLFHKYLESIFTVTVFYSIYIAIKKYRNFNGGYLNFTKGFQISFLISLISGLIWSSYRYIQYKLSPSIVEEIIRENKAVLADSWISADKVEYMMNITESTTTPATLAFLNTFLMSMILGGSILSLFLAFILKRSNLKKN